MVPVQATALREGIVTRRRVIISILVAIALGGVVFAFSEAGDEPVTVTVRGVESVFPAQGSLALRQDRVMADLEQDLDGVLKIDGVEIPEDQLDRTPELGQVSFTPGEGKEFERFDAGRHRATVVFWSVSEGRGVSDREFTWAFNVH
jgi:hypothetical protein